MSWTAVVPLKQGGGRKTRLGGRLSPDERADLGDRMAAHVVECLARVPAIGRVLVLSAQRDPESPHEWRRDAGRGLNEELSALRDDEGGKLLVIHGDLPLVTSDDIEALIEAAGERGCAIAPDRHDSGTNALAIAHDGPFEFSFGDNSFALHRAASAGQGIAVRRPGLSIDVDTPDDLDAAIAAGFPG